MSKIEGVIGPFICYIEQAREVVNHFTKDEILE